MLLGCPSAGVPAGQFSTLFIARRNSPTIAGLASSAMLEIFGQVPGQAISSEPPTRWATPPILAGTTECQPAAGSALIRRYFGSGFLSTKSLLSRMNTPPPPGPSARALGGMIGMPRLRSSLFEALTPA